MGRASTQQKIPSPRPSSRLSRTSWPALSSVSFLRRAPRYWLTTTAPPVARAASRLITRLLIMSTRLTPEMAASPHRDTIMVSAIPTVVASSCSISSGTISFTSSLVVKMGAPGPFFRILGALPSTICSMKFDFLLYFAAPAKPGKFPPAGAKRTYLS